MFNIHSIFVIAILFKQLWCFKELKKARKEKWQNFVNSLNDKALTKKMWDKFKKINESYIPRIVPHWRREEK